jgi:hypothetical protein
LKIGDKVKNDSRELKVKRWRLEEKTGICHGGTAVVAEM